MLLVVEGENLKANVAHYHHSWFRSFTYLPAKHEAQNDDAYSKFCNEIIEERIVNGGEVIKISKLAEMFSYYLHPDGDAPQVSNWNLKRKLKKTFPSLIYISKPKKLQIVS